MRLWQFGAEQKSERAHARATALEANALSRTLWPCLKVNAVARGAGEQHTRTRTRTRAHARAQTHTHHSLTHSHEMLAGEHIDAQHEP